MKKILFISVTSISIGIIGLVILNVYVRETRPLASYNMQIIQIGTSTASVLVADTEKKRTQGLMGVTNLAPDSGMIFYFPDAAPRIFWNKNTHIDLDIIWIADGTVVGVTSLPSITRSGTLVRVFSPQPVDTVVEMNAGWAQEHGVTAGYTVQQ